MKHITMKDYIRRKIIYGCITLVVMVIVLISAMFITGAREESKAPNYQQDLAYKKVALTYDDGPDAQYTLELLEVLDKYHVKATFFVLGKAVDANPEIVKQLKDSGHIIGNHTYNHVNLGQQSLQDGELEMAKTSEAIYQATGEYPILFRPPFGNYHKELEKNSDMLFVLWDVDPLDWQCQNTNTICSKVMKKIQENDIILMHDSYETTVRATELLIPELQKQGYQFVTVDELLYD